MRRVLLAVPTIACLVPLPALGERIDALYEALGLSEAIAIISEEGAALGAEIESELFPGRGGDRWKAEIARVHDPAAMEADLRAGLDAELAGVDLAPAEAFFGSDVGRRIIRLENSARRAMLDAEVEEAGVEILEDMIRSRDPRLDALKEFAEINELVELNVAGALNSNYAFYVGFAEGGAFGDALDEGDLLADVWAQEEAVRSETEEWVFSLLATAYGPLADEELDAYIAFSRTSAGQATNLALFAAFDGMYSRLSRNLGLAAARFFVEKDL